MNSQTQPSKRIILGKLSDWQKWKKQYGARWGALEQQTLLKKAVHWGPIALKRLYEEGHISLKNIYLSPSWKNWLQSKHRNTYDSAHEMLDILIEKNLEPSDDWIEHLAPVLKAAASTETPLPHHLRPWHWRILELFEAWQNAHILTLNLVLIDWLNPTPNKEGWYSTQNEFYKQTLPTLLKQALQSLDQIKLQPLDDRSAFFQHSRVQRFLQSTTQSIFVSSLDQSRNLYQRNLDVLAQATNLDQHMQSAESQAQRKIRL